MHDRDADRAEAIREEVKLRTGRWRGKSQVQVGGGEDAGDFPQIAREIGNHRRVDVHHAPAS